MTPETRKFYVALSALDIALVTKMLKSDPGLAHLVDAMGFTPLMYMVMPAICMEDLNFSKCPMHIFIAAKNTFCAPRNKHKRLALAQLLINYGTPVDARSTDSFNNTELLGHIESTFTAVHLYLIIPTIALAEDIDFVKLLLKNGANASARGFCDKTILMYAVSIKGPQSIAIARELVRRGVDVNAEDDEGQTALHYNMSNDCRPDVVKLLLDAGANPDPVDFEYYTPLMFAVLQTPPRPSVVKMLIARGANVNAVSSETNSVLHMLINSCCLSMTIFKMLLQAGANVFAITDQAKTTLMRAAVSSSATAPAVIKELVARGVDVNAVDENGMTALHQHVRFHENRAIVRTLMDAGAVVDDFARYLDHVRPPRNSAKEPKCKCAETDSPLPTARKPVAPKSANRRTR